MGGATSSLSKIEPSVLEDTDGADDWLEAASFENTEEGDEAGELEAIPELKSMRMCSRSRDETPRSQVVP